MTLAIGNKLVKCNDDGTPVENEGYVLFEVIDLTGTYEDMSGASRTTDPRTSQPRTDEKGNVVQFVKLRKLR